MNLVAYDRISGALNKNKTWISPSTYSIYSKEIKYRKYYTIVTKYNPDEKETEYFIVLTDSELSTDKTYHVIRYGSKLRFYVKMFWNLLYLYLFDKEENIDIELVEEQDDGEIYRIDF